MAVDNVASAASLCSKFFESLRSPILTIRGKIKSSAAVDDVLESLCRRFVMIEDMMDSSSGIERAYANESSALVVWEIILRTMDESSWSWMAAKVRAGEKQLDNAQRDCAVALRVAASVESRKFHTLFQTLNNSSEDAVGSTALYATMALPKAWTQLAESTTSDFEGGNESTTRRTSGS